MSDNNKKDKDLNETPKTETNENNGTEEIVEVEQEIVQTNESGDDTSSEEKKKSKEKKQKKGSSKIKDFFKKIFSKKNLKWTIPAIALIVAAISVATVFIVIGVNKNKSDEVSSEYLTLNHYTVELTKDQTVQLEVKKFDQTGKELPIKEISYVSEAEKVVSVENGLLTGNIKGETYVQITADGLKTACFVSVVEQNDKNGLEIKTVETCLFRGVPVNVYVYEYINGVGNPIDADITWSVSDSSVLSMTGNTVTALKKADGALIKASFTYKGQEYNLEFTATIEEPYVYYATSNEIKLADLKTFSGADNDKFTTTSINIIRKDVVTNNEVVLPSSDLALSLSDAAIVTAAGNGNDVNISAKAFGQASIIAEVNGTKAAVGVRVTVVTPIASIADMDALSLACHNNPNALGATVSYMMVNDIDYNGQVIYPIAPTSNTTNYAEPVDYVGIQWKYLVEVSEYDDKSKPIYKYVDRDKVGTIKEDTTCYGLSDEEFVAFAKVGGLNPYNSRTAWSSTNWFKGTFDGNGFAIKNAQIMNAAYVTKSGDTIQGRAGGVFGYVSEGTIKNLTFEKVTMQSLAKFGPDGDGTAKDGKDLYRYYDYEQDKIIEKGAGLTVQNNYLNCAVIRLCWNNSKISNVFVEFDKSNFGEFTRTNVTGALVAWAKTSVIENCIVEITGASYGGADNDYALDLIDEYKETDVTRRPYYYNNICIGIKNAMPAFTNKKLEDGNVWTKNGWEDLKNQTAGADANSEKVKTLDQIVASFNSKIWDFTAFNSGGAPKLINGCSIKG